MSFTVFASAWGMYVNVVPVSTIIWTGEVDGGADDVAVEVAFLLLRLWWAEGFLVLLLPKLYPSTVMV